MQLNPAFNPLAEFNADDIHLGRSNGSSYEPEKYATTSELNGYGHYEDEPATIGDEIPGLGARVLATVLDAGKLAFAYVNAKIAEFLDRHLVAPVAELIVEREIEDADLAVLFALSTTALGLLVALTVLVAGLVSPAAEFFAPVSVLAAGLLLKAAAGFVLIRASRLADDRDRELDAEAILHGV